jgi:hypothetical protein
MKRIALIALIIFIAGTLWFRDTLADYFRSTVTGPGSKTLSKALRQYGGRDPNELLAQIDWTTYFNEVGFTDFRKLQADRLAVWRRCGDGDDFLYTMAEHFCLQFPLPQAHGDSAILFRVLKEKSDIAIFHLNAGERTEAGISARNCEPYRIIGYFVLGKIAQRLSLEINSGQVSRDNPEALSLLEVLRNNNVHPTIEDSDWAKLWNNLLGGNIDYIFSRLRQKVAPPSPSSLALQLEDLYQSPSLDVFQAVQGREKSGTVIFLNRARVHADYFASNVLHRFRSKPRKIAVMSGGYTNNYRTPEGLTVDDGHIVNSVLLTDRDALVIIETSGGARVINLKDPVIGLPDGHRINNPRDSLRAYSTFLHWCRANNGTCFQTHLLAYSDSLLVDPAKSSSKKAERRMLALATTKDGSLKHVIFNIRAESTLAGCAEAAFHTLKTRNYTVQALVNLDTGGQDVIEVYREDGRTITEVEGRLGVDRTTNLLVYSF